jgi:GT2 family glycosyltransferase
MKTMLKDKKIAAVQSKILLMNNKKKFDYAGGSGGFIDKYGYPFTRGRLFYTSEFDSGQYDNQIPVFWTSGAAMLVRKEYFIEIGMFDDKFFLYMEEIDICWRFWNKGYKTTVVPQSIVYHKVAGSAKRTCY